MNSPERHMENAAKALFLKLTSEQKKEIIDLLRRLLSQQEPPVSYHHSTD